MDQCKSESASPGLPVSLSLGNEFLGWYRAKDISMEGMRVTGPVRSLAESSTLTVCFELETRETFLTQLFKALVIHQETNSVVLEWVKQDAQLFKMTPGIPAKDPNSSGQCARVNILLGTKPMPASIAWNKGSISGDLCNDAQTLRRQESC
ncbi:MAG: hypothetical protein WD002_04135 [Pseudomonadales bacterium]